MSDVAQWVKRNLTLCLCDESLHNCLHLSGCVCVWKEQEEVENTQCIDNSHPTQNKPDTQGKKEV